MQFRDLNYNNAVNRLPHIHLLFTNFICILIVTDKRDCDMTWVSCFCLYKSRRTLVYRNEKKNSQGLFDCLSLRDRKSPGAKCSKIR